MRYGPRPRSFWCEDDDVAPTERLTIDAYTAIDHTPVYTGLVSADGKPIYRYPPEALPMGFQSARKDR